MIKQSVRRVLSTFLAEEKAQAIYWACFDRTVEDDALPDFSYSIGLALMVALPEEYDKFSRVTSRHNLCGCRTRFGNLVIMNPECCAHGLRSRHYAQALDRRHHKQLIP